MGKLLPFLLLLIGLSILLTSCEEEPGIQRFHSGEVETEDILFLGGDLTAGYTNFGWSKEKQENAFSVLFLEHLKQFENFEYKVPYLPSEVSTGGWELNRFKWSNCEDSFSYPVFKESGWNVSALDEVYWQGPFNVIGIPRILTSSIQVQDLYYTNPYFKRLISPNSPDATVSEFTSTRTPSFYVIEFGHGEIMRYLINGGVDNQARPHDIMSNKDFEQTLDSLILSIKDSDNHGVLVNITMPDYFPFLNTVPVEYIDPQTCVFSGFNYLIETKTGLVREAGSSDRILLPAASKLNTLGDAGGVVGLSTSDPVPNNMVIDEEELVYISNIVSDRNAILRYLAGKHDLMFLDLNELYREVSVGMNYYGTSYSTEYIEGQFFNIDGISPLPKGNAMIANKLIALLNQNAGANIPYLDILQY